MAAKLSSVAFSGGDGGGGEGVSDDESRMRTRVSSSIEMRRRRSMAREVSVATKTTRMRSAKSGRTVRFIGNAFFKEQFVAVAKFGNGSKILGFDGSASDPFLLSSEETLGIKE